MNYVEFKKITSSTISIVNSNKGFSNPEVRQSLEALVNAYEVVSNEGSRGLDKEHYSKYWLFIYYTLSPNPYKKEADEYMDWAIKLRERVSKYDQPYEEEEEELEDTEVTWFEGQIDYGNNIYTMNKSKPKGGGFFFGSRQTNIILSNL